MLPSDIPPKRIGVYLRTSTGDQRKKATIESQFYYAQQWLGKYDIDINQCRIYKDDGISSSLLISKGQRTAGQEMLKAAEDSLISHALFYATDRLAREAHDFHAFEKQMRAVGVTMVSMVENIDTSSPDGIMMMGLFAVFAQRERARIMERSQVGRERIASKGGWTGGTPPFGYKVENGSLVPCYPAADHIALIFDLYIELKSTKKVAEHLYKKSVSSPKGNERWHPAMISKYLRSSVYKGVKEYNKKSERKKITASCPPLVDEGKWEHAQRILNHHKKAFRSFATENPYMLAGLLFCAYCGKLYHGCTDKQYRRYRHSETPVKCPLPRRPMIQTKFIEAQVWNAILTWVQNPGDVLFELQQELSGEGTSGLIKKLERLKIELKTANQEKDRIRRFLIQEILDEEDGRIELPKIRKKIKALENTISDTQDVLTSAEAMQQHINNTEKMLEALCDAALGADESTKREIAHTLIDRVDVFYDTQGRGRGGVTTVKIHACFSFV